MNCVVEAFAHWENPVKVEEACDINPFANVARPVCVNVPLTVTLLPKVAAPFELTESAAVVEVAPAVEVAR